MSGSSTLLLTRQQEGETRQGPRPLSTQRLRVLVVGQELRVEGLSLLLAMQQDMDVLSPLSDLEQTVEVVARMIAAGQGISVVVMDWDGPFDQSYSILVALCALSQRCLVVASRLSAGELEQLRRAGALGCCCAGVSRQQLAQAIRKVAAGRPAFLFPERSVDLVPTLSAHRRLVFHPERLEARGADIGWQLNETDIQIIYHTFMNAREKTPGIAEKVKRAQGTIRTNLSGHIFLFLGLLADCKVSSRIEAFQVLLEYGIFEYQ